ncbi:DUF927 domain-containing protein [Yersinia enterocolitica]|uniref:DUF927 domain-containing protein n=1 Tax=Yersinia intermedia TaxID=631 RepID=A0A208ZV41_YERIN|nr:DUF927 domain-containing protein [Yersinia intermedia]EKN3392579.1 DUF927 domain-containing protein [Yersinia enterocolitica]OVZ84344.1 hypothetical protein CBW57_17505 [Yersinia intermedia]
MQMNLIPFNGKGILQLKIRVNKVNNMTIITSSEETMKLPTNFVEDNGRIYFRPDDGDKEILVSAQSLTPVAKACNRALNGNWHIVLQCVNHSGAVAEVIISLKKAKMNIDAIIAQLAGMGVFIQHRKLFMQFLEGACELDLPVYRVATRPGFQPEELVFMFGPLPVFIPEREGIQGVIPSEDMNVNHSIVVAGTLEEWQESVAGKVHGLLPKLAILVGLSSSILPLVGESGAIFHICGDSSTGKTAAMQIGASVNGLAAEPGSGSPTQIQRWNSTSNGLELLMATSNGSTLCLDELGSFTSKFFAQTLYDVVSGMSKTRMDGESFGMAHQSTWSQNVLSTGELTIVERIRQEKSQVMDGMLHRALSIPVTAEDSRRDRESTDVARQRIGEIKTSLLAYHGSAGFEFIYCLTGLSENGQYFDLQTTSCYLKDRLANLLDELQRRLHANQITLNILETRALQRFAVLYLTGVLAVEWSILPWTNDVVSDVVYESFNRWLIGYRGDAGRKENILMTVQNFIAVNQLKFIDVKLPSVSFRRVDIAGYALRDGSYLILPDTLEKLGEYWGLSAKKLALLLDAAGYLKRCEDDRLTTRKVIQKVSVTGYCVSSTFAEAQF